MARQFAVFDIDGTVIRTSLLQLLLKELVNRGRVGGAAAGDIVRILHDGRQRIDDKQFGFYMKQAVQMILQHTGGKLSIADYEDALGAVARSLSASTYVYTRQLIDTLKKSGFYLIAISGTESRALQIIAKELGFDTCSAGVKYLDDGLNLSGEMQSFNVTKDVALRSIIAAHGLKTRGSLAVGDTDNDVPILNMVSQPIAFNPNQALFATARAKEWMVVIERKDMVYGMQSENGQYILKSVNM